MLRKKMLFLSLITILLFSWNCSQPASIGAPPGSDEPSISFNYELTGAFESVVKSELSRAQTAFYKTKMKVINLKNAQVTTYNWVVSLDKEALKVTSYSSVALENGTYNFEMLINAGDYQYYGQSGAVEIKL